MHLREKLVFLMAQIRFSSRKDFSDIRLGNYIQKAAVIITAA